MTDWSIQDARRTYNLAHWSGGYFDVNTQGHLEVRPHRGNQTVIDLYQLTRDATQTLTPPILLRFTSILHDRVDMLCSAFNTAMQAMTHTRATAANARRA